MKSFLTSAQLKIASAIVVVAALGALGTGGKVKPM